MKKLNITASVLALLIVPASQAAWELVNDFESGTTGVTHATSPIAAEGGNGGIQTVEWPAASGNMVLELDPGVFANGTDTNNSWFYLTLPDMTASGTVYSRFAKAGDFVDIVWGTSPDAEPNSYGGFSSAFRVELDSILDYRNGSIGYTEIIGATTSAQTWYDTWIVVDVATNTYDLWIKGGIWPSATKVVTGADFRNQTTDPQNRFYARMSAGSLESPKSFDVTYFDDIWVDTAGQNISIPSAADPTDPLSGGSVPQDNGAGRMSNLSTNTVVGPTGLTTGFVVSGGTGETRRIMIRAVGPGLGQFNVAGFMADPVLEIRTDNGATLVATGDDWGDEANAPNILVTAASLGAFALPVGSADAVIMMSLPKGVYTAGVSGKDGGTGSAIIEVYPLD